TGCPMPRSPAPRIAVGCPRMSLQRGPDAAVVRWDRERCLVERHNSIEIKITAVQLLDVVPADREPEWHRLVHATGVHCDQYVCGPVSCEEQNVMGLKSHCST